LSSLGGATTANERYITCTHTYPHTYIHSDKTLGVISGAGLFGIGLWHIACLPSGSDLALVWFGFYGFLGADYLLFLCPVHLLHSIAHLFITELAGFFCPPVFYCLFVNIRRCRLAWLLERESWGGLVFAARQVGGGGSHGLFSPFSCVCDWFWPFSSMGGREVEGRVGWIVSLCEVL